jgi:hypothetical protein
MRKVAIISSHGLYANYGGWDQLVNNLAERKSDDNINYLIFNSKETRKDIIPPDGIEIKHINMSASGFEGLFYDFWTILICYFKVDTLVLLGASGIPMIAFLSIFKKKVVVSNVAGIEWKRPKNGYITNLYWKLCFRLSFIFSKYVILDNQYFNFFAPKKSNAKVVVLPYGGEIDTSLNVTTVLVEKYPFLNDNYYLSISRSLEDNFIAELCETFLNLNEKLVMISNFSSTKYGKMVFEKYSGYDNLILINGLYDKPELDLVRRKCAAYIHTHTLCGTAPSLVEMIISQRPIIAVDIPQNRFTLANHGFYYKNFTELKQFLAKSNNLDVYIPPKELCAQYEWDLIVKNYQDLYH